MDKVRIFDNSNRGELTNIVILRALQLGDLLCAVPALRTLRAALPEARVTLIGLPWARTFVERFDHYLDEYIEFPGVPGFPEREPQIQAFPSFLALVQGQKFDLALQMQGSGNISNVLVALFGARLTAGFYLPGQYSPDPERFLAYPDHEPEIWRHLRLMEHLGFPLQGDQLEFPMRRQDWSAFQALRERWGLEPGTYICLHPGARAEDRRWPAERFALVADALAGFGFQVVLTGTAAEGHLTRAVAAQMRRSAVDLAGQTDLGSLAALLSGARLLVCNDTGISHLASALKVPSVVLFMASDPHRWAPLDRARHRAVLWATAAAPEVVIAAAEDLLAMDLVHANV